MREREESYENNYTLLLLLYTLSLSFSIVDKCNVNRETVSHIW